MYLKGRKWWNYVPPISASWGWKEICKVRDLFKEGYRGNIWLARSQKGYFVTSGYKWLQGEHKKKCGGINGSGIDSQFLNTLLLCGWQL